MREMEQLNYIEAMEYLQAKRNVSGELSLDSIKELLKRLGNPEDELKFVHVAGTNGKGSTSAYLTAILVEADYKVGRFISPVVICYEECIQTIKMNGIVTTQFIEKENVAKHISRIREICIEMEQDGFSHPTTFEMETAMAFMEFVEKNVDVVILEVGLGGRLDATNVIQNVLCSVITSISMDHMQFLGNSLSKIAREKAGIIRSGVPVVSYDQPEEAKKEIVSVCKEKGAKLYMLHNADILVRSMSLHGATFMYESEEPYYIPLLGKHQVYNALVAINVAYVLKDVGFRITDEHVRLGLANTKWFGRFSIVGKKPYIIVDGAHNVDAAKMLVESLELYFPNKKGIFIMGVFADKEYEEILAITAPYAKQIITVTTHTERALASKELMKSAKRYCDDVQDGKTVANALSIAKKIAKEEDYILCFGSLSFLGDVYRSECASF